MKNIFTKIILPVLILALLFTLARAIQTPEVEIGNSGAYDGAVKIRRDIQGRMQFSDSEVTVPVTLNDLRYSGVDHGLMLGLADDDHSQYHTAARHAAVHSSAFNGALPTSADVHGNLTLGAHLLDAVIHPLPGVYEPAFASGTPAQYRRGDKTWQPLNQAAVAGLTADDTPQFAGLGVNGAPTAKFEVVDTASISPRGILSKQLSDDANGARVGFAKARWTGGAYPAGSLAAVQANDTIGRLMFRAYDGANYLEMGSIELLATGSVAATRVPTEMRFSTATDAAPSVLAERLRIDNAGLMTSFGNLSVGSDGGGNKELRVYSSQPGKYTRIANAGGNTEIYSNGGYYAFIAGAGQNFYQDAGGSFYWRDVDAGSAVRLSVDSATGDINNIAGAYKTGGVTRLAADGSAVLSQADVDNLRLDGNTLSSTNANGNIALAPGGTGQVTVSGDLAVGSGGAKFQLNGQRVIPGRNLLDNPDFNIWQRNIAQTCATGGNAAGTILWPVPGTLSTGADRWQISRAKTDMATTVSRAALPAPLPTALYCLKNEYAAGSDCFQFIHQTIPRDVTASLRGKWVTFAVSHYLNGASGGNVGIFKFVGSTPTALVNYAFTASANSWDRFAVTALVPTDADTLCVSIKSNMSVAGPTIACIANAVLVEGRFVASTEKVTDPAESSVPPQPRNPAEDLERCQRYYEKGALAFTSYAPGTDTSYYYSMVHFNTAKAGTPTIALSNINGGGLSGLTTAATPFPAYSAGQSWPQGFRATLSGSAASQNAVHLSADWTAACPEPN